MEAAKFQKDAASAALKAFQSGRRRFLVADEAGLGKTHVACEVLRGLLPPKGKKPPFPEGKEPLLPEGKPPIVYYFCSSRTLAQDTGAKLIKAAGGEEGFIQPQGDERPSLSLTDTHKIKLCPDKINLFCFSANLLTSAGTGEELKILLDRLNAFLRLEACSLWKDEEWKNFSKLWKSFMLSSKKTSQSPENLRPEERENTMALLRKIAFGAANRYPPDLIIVDEFHRYDGILAGVLEQYFLSSTALENPPPFLLMLSATPYNLYPAQEWLDGKDTEDSDNNKQSTAFKSFTLLLQFLRKGDQCRARADAVKDLYEAYQDGTLDSDKMKKILTNRYRTYENKESDGNQMFQVLVDLYDACQKGTLDSTAAISGVLKQYIYRNERLTGDQQKYRDLPGIEYFTPELLQDCQDDLLRQADVKHTANRYEKLFPGVYSFPLQKAAENLEFANIDKFYEGLRFGEKEENQDKNFLFCAGASDGQAVLNNGSRERLRQFLRTRVILDFNVEEAGGRQLLWMPPTHPYYAPGKESPFAKYQRFTKLMVFSGYTLIPRALAATFSAYVDACNVDACNDPKRAAKSLSLSLLDKEIIAANKRNSGFIDQLAALWEPVLNDCTSAEALVEAIQNKQACRDLAEELQRQAKELQAKEPEEPQWTPARTAKYALASPLICAYRALKSANCSKDPGPGAAPGQSAQSGQTDMNAGRTGQVLGVDDIADTADDIADTADDIADTADDIANAFNSYFDKNGIRQALLGQDIRDADALLDYCVQGNLQALLDEYFYCLGGANKSSAKTLCNALAYQKEGTSSQVRVFTHKSANHFATSGTDSREIVPCLYADRLSADGEDTGAADTAKPAMEHFLAVKEAFNSPFWPMLLCTTSRGQEGIDLDRYCMRIMHYTLPSNPMSFEQRDGRVDRRQSLLARRRMNEMHGSDCRGTGHAFWAELFSRDRDADGLCPKWCQKPNTTKLRQERLLPFYPCSREETAYQTLLNIKNRYRGSFGKPNERVMDPGDKPLKLNGLVET